MKLHAEVVKHTPVFVLPVRGAGPWGAVWGATRRGPDWVFPAYHPFGARVLDELMTAVPGLALDDSTASVLAGLAADAALDVAAEAAWRARRFAELPLPAGHRFHRAPFCHQLYGVALGLARRRKFYLWDMGVGKTGMLVELLRLLRARGELGKALVVMPPVVLGTWEREVAEVTQGALTTCTWAPEEVTTKALRQSGLADKHAVLVARATAADVVLVSYPQARLEALAAAKAKRPDALKALGCDFVCADESQNLGNHESAQTAAVNELAKGVARRALLSGTAADAPEKLYGQLAFLAPGLAPRGPWAFRRRYVRTHPEMPHLVLGYDHLDELNAAVDTVASRLKKTECLDLPPRTTVDVRFRLGRKQAARYNELVAEAKATADLLTRAPPGTGRVHLRVLDADDDLDDADAAVSQAALASRSRDLTDREQLLVRAAEGGVRSSKLRQVLSGFLLPSVDLTVCDGCPHLAACVAADVAPYTRACHVAPKAPVVAPTRDFENPRLAAFTALLGNILDADPTNKVIVWANFRQELADLTEVCAARGVGHVRVDGTTRRHLRAYEAQFATDAGCRVWISQSAMGVGITLNSANYSIDYAPTWDRVHHRQKRDRNYRAGQTRPVTEYRLIAADTIDEHILATLGFKDTVAFTLLEQVRCVGCEHARRCAAAEVRPFREGCAYAAAPTKPRGTPGLVDGA